MIDIKKILKKTLNKIEKEAGDDLFDTLHEHRSLLGSYLLIEIEKESVDYWLRELKNDSNR